MLGIRIYDDTAPMYDVRIFSVSSLHPSTGSEDGTANNSLVCHPNCHTMQSPYNDILSLPFLKADSKSRVGGFESLIYPLKCE
ncbi:hypothetical protein CEXT_119741 [Caerostris extrusa]|uniref:Uncharacterized protein n=1 Tax=Caerostris extrusa TaxID=172846 RepID=A0AAV4U4W4_CAEEX|nr:hypothetical protein CEXT_119741 [Caerostris extrusa]